MATGLFSGTLRAYPDPSFPGCNSAFIQSVYFSKSVLVVLLSATTLWPHFRLSAERHLVRLFRSLCRGCFRLPLSVCFLHTSPRSIRVGSFAGFAHDQTSRWFHNRLALSFRYLFYFLACLSFIRSAPMHPVSVAMHQVAQTCQPVRNRSLFCLMYKRMSAANFCFSHFRT